MKTRNNLNNEYFTITEKTNFISNLLCLSEVLSKQLFYFYPIRNLTYHAYTNLDYIYIAKKIVLYPIQNSYSIRKLIYFKVAPNLYD